MRLLLIQWKKAACYKDRAKKETHDLYLKLKEHFRSPSRSLHPWLLHFSLIMTRIPKGAHSLKNICMHIYTLYVLIYERTYMSLEIYSAQRPKRCIKCCIHFQDHCHSRMLGTVVLITVSTFESLTIWRNQWPRMESLHLSLSFGQRGQMIKINVIGSGLKPTPNSTRTMTNLAWRLYN